MGLPGTGKTHLATLLAQKTGALHLSSDLIRKAVGKRNQYSEGDKQVVYESLLTHLKEGLSSGRQVVVDTTFYQQTLRDRFETLARNYTDEVYWIRTTAAESEIKKRVSKKRPDSEADFQVYLKLRNIWDEVSQKHLLIETDKKSEEAILNDMLTYCKFSTQ